MAKTELAIHPKFRRLVKRLGIPRPYVVGLLETMWHVGYETGDTLLGDPIDVELAADWPGEEGVFFEAVKSDFLDLIDGRYHIHDLRDHAPDYVQKKMDRRASRSAPDPSRREAGHVYLMRGMNGLIKIGFTSDVERRAREIQNASGSPVFPIHSRFNSKRKFGEWFELSQEDVQFAKDVIDADSSPFISVAE